VQRVSVVGTTGSGKSTVTEALVAALGLPSLELDSLRHRPGWVPMPDDEFRAEVAAFTAGEAWVVDGNYFEIVTGEAVWPRADTVVWLDLPRPLVMRQLVGRTARRIVRREVLWNGNRESWHNLLRRDDRNVLRWAWRSHQVNRERFARAIEHLDASVVRLRSRVEVRDFIDGLREDTAQ
jgi:adenylate kinase family enzyme